MKQLPPCYRCRCQPCECRDGITLYHADCRDVLPLLPSIDLMLTDPPYGVDLGQHKALRDHCTLAKGGYLSYEDTPENFSSIIVPLVRRFLQSIGRAVVFAASTNMWEFPKPCAVGGIYLPAGCGRNRWGFTNFSHCLFYGVNPHNKHGSQQTVMSSTETAERNGHPCPKPIGWMKWLVGMASLNGETIIDPLAGSGTTGRACKDLGRRCIMVEIEDKYCDIAAERLRQEVLF